MSNKIKVTFLGTAGAVPTVRRNHTAVLLNYRDENILVDCGEGVQRQFRKAGLNPCKLTKILITHWHGDHVLGIPGLLQTLAFSGYNKTLCVYGPRGTKKFMDLMLKTFIFEEKISVKVFEIDKGVFFENDYFSLEACSLDHRINCNGYCFVEKGKRRINKEKLEKSGLRSGPLLKKLKSGKDVSYEGKKYLASKLTFVEEKKKICFVWDTGYDKKISKFVEGADLFVCEATLSKEFEEFAKKARHLTSEQAGKIAKDAGVKKLGLIHVSQRYENNLRKILKEAKEVFKNSFVPKDLDVVEV
ncbi:ribonuclease Z [Nanoarchaeota archaeon]